jgi:hypothetical protein
MNLFSALLAERVARYSPDVTGSGAGARFARYETQPSNVVNS